MTFSRPGTVRLSTVTFLKNKQKNPFKGIWEKKTIPGKPNRNNFGVSARSQAVQIADIPWCGHRFTPTHHFLHPPVPMYVDLQSEGSLTRKESTHHRNKETRNGTLGFLLGPASPPWGHTGAHSPLPNPLPGQHHAPIARAHMPPGTPTTPQEDVSINLLMGNQRLAYLYLGDQQKPWGAWSMVTLSAEPGLRAQQD